jgi:hypothetical protein
MRQELAPWTTTEERNLRRRSRNEPILDEAKRLVSSGRHDQALRLYQELFEQNGNILAGFNASILLASNEQFSEALALLENVHNGQLLSGQNTPRFIRREIQKMTGFVNGLSILEEYRASRVNAIRSDNTNPLINLLAPVVPMHEPENARELRGTINLSMARIYALSESITNARDPSIWSKIVASADVDAREGRWSMRLPGTAPSQLWFVVIDSQDNLFITQTALNISGPVFLDTAWMTRLE